MFRKKTPPSAGLSTSESINDNEPPPPPPAPAAAKKSWFGSKPKEPVKTVEPEPQWPWINEDEWILVEKVSYRNLRLHGGVKGNKFKVDDKIEINYKAKGTWYPGKIIKERGNNIYDIKFNDKPPPKKSWLRPKPKKEEPVVIEEEKEGQESDEVVDSDEEEVVDSDEEEVVDSDEEEVVDSDEEEVVDGDEEEVVDSDEEEVIESDEEGADSEEVEGNESKEETGGLEEMLGADSEDEADAYDAEEEERFVQECRAKLTENYQVARWIKQIELKKKIALVREIQDQIEVNDRIKKGATWFGKSDSLAVENYWDEEAKIKATMSPAAIKGISIIQVVWKYWLDLKRLRVARKVGSGGADMIVYIQTAIRRWEARQTALSLREERNRKMNQFKEFCEVMKEGVTLICFSRKYGGSGPRLIKFNDENTELKYVAGFMNTRSIELKNIYQVGEGVSGYTYPNAHPTRTAWCFYLELIGDKFLDFECYSKKQVQMMVHGFRRLRHLYYTMAPFYFDAVGTPRRAGPSIIEMALKGGGKVESLSVAGEMRYRQALRCLNFEYNDWMNLYDGEKTEWEEKNHSLFDTQDALTGEGEGQEQEVEENEQEDVGDATERETVAATEMTEDVGEIVVSDEIVEASYDAGTDAPVKKPSRFWNALKLGMKFKREPKKEPDNLEKLDGFVDANNISLTELEAILDKKRAESAANSGEESEYEEIEVTDSEEEVDDSEEVEEEEVEEEVEVEEVVEEQPQQIRKVQPLHANLPKSAPSDRNKHIRYTPG